MRYEFISELEVDACADYVWEIYSSPNFPTLAVQFLQNILKSKDILEGDGYTVGSIMRLVLLPGYCLPPFKEKILTVDHDKRLKELQTIEGGYLEMGCTFSKTSFEILVKEKSSCVIKVVTKYEINDDLATSVYGHLHTYFDGCVTLARWVSKHVTEKNARAAN
ncbi:hypothetical protein C5167_040710 [Papaver somniferum]|uniref:Bet v I/Major latex protein domain-containing protein n=1 Tax=Papaver somniferum TaxID=3469 RepID=A0A4Y7IJ33_PAPSO|nr:S-norcoclaurine synthase 2-like [Papaver somniferum]RZC47760.1 hypothetical protein C5167_040710 [Papaver somniferum]